MRTHCSNSPRRRRYRAPDGLAIAAVMVASLALGAITSVAPRSASAHGIWGHIHVTGWAIENLPPGELREFLSEPEVLNAALFGAAFTDSGYWPQFGDISRRSRAYAEHTHWEPFVQDFVEWIRVNDPPPWDELESRKRVAFLMGCAAHGLQDEVFDSLFLYQVDEHDHGGQDEADPGTDGFLALDGHIRFIPEPWYPTDTLLELYSGLSEEIDEEIIELSVGAMTAVYINETSQVAQALGEENLEIIPWTSAHYLDPEIPGSLRAEILPTAGYLQALWARLHGELGGQDVIAGVYPAPPRRLLGVDHNSPDSWVTFVFGVGLRFNDIVGSWTGQDGDDISISLGNTRWGATYSRLVRLMPNEALAPGAWYTARLEAGIERIDGLEVDVVHTHEFQVPCDDSTAERCPDLGEIPAPRIDGSTPPPEDAGFSDTSTADATPDANVDETSGGGGTGCVVAANPAAPGGGAPALLLLVAVVATRRIRAV